MDLLPYRPENGEHCTHVGRSRGNREGAGRDVTITFRFDLRVAIGLIVGAVAISISVEIGCVLAGADLARRIHFL